MKNILWIQSNQDLALTTIYNDNIDSAAHAEELISNGNIPNDWTIAAYDITIPTDKVLDFYKWENGQFVEK
jgi:hypothetical protein